jgi:hypothetical protein
LTGGAQSRRSQALPGLAIGAGVGVVEDAGGAEVLVAPLSARSTLVRGVAVSERRRQRPRDAVTPRKDSLLGRNSR